jgi:hypothetical protein
LIDYGPGLRRVRKLSLSLDDSDRQIRGMRFVEEALRLMTLPAETASTVIYIRKARFPIICDAETTWHYAYLVERLCTRLSQEAVHLRAHNAAGANAVFARSPVEAWAIFAERLAEGAAAQEWFWPLATTGFSSQHAHSATTLPAVLLRVHADFGWLGTLEFLKTCSPTTLRTIVERLTETDATQLGVLQLDATTVIPREQVAHGETQGEAVTLPETALPESLYASLPPLWGELCRAFVPLWGREDARTIWLCSAGLLMNSVERLMDARLPTQARALAEVVNLKFGKIADRSQKDITATVAGQLGDGYQDEAQECAEGDVINPLNFAEQPAVATQHAADAEQLAIASLQRTPTAFAGFFFVIALLNRLGLAEALLSVPELIDARFVARLLQSLMHAGGVSATDPITTADWDEKASLEEREMSLTATPLMLPACWRAREPRAAAWPITRLIRIWELAVRRETRRLTGQSLTKLMTRAGSFAFTRTHLNVFLAQEAMDLRVRRAGLDLDPGWTPWLGKVVAFHYACEVFELAPGFRRTGD